MAERRRNANARLRPFPGAERVEAADSPRLVILMRRIRRSSSVKVSTKPFLSRGRRFLVNDVRSSPKREANKLIGRGPV